MLCTSLSHLPLLIPFMHWVFPVFPGESQDACSTFSAQWRVIEMLHSLKESLTKEREKTSLQCRWNCGYECEMTDGGVKRVSWFSEADL